MRRNTLEKKLFPPEKWPKPIFPIDQYFFGEFNTFFRRSYLTLNVFDHSTPKN